MDFLKKLFAGGGQSSGGDSAGLYLYIQPHGCQEVIRVRIDRNNDLSLRDDNETYYVRKMAMGSDYRCMRQVEVELYFSSSRQLENVELRGGKQVTGADYEAWVAAQAEKAE